MIRNRFLCILTLTVAAIAPLRAADHAYVRVNQVGYETGNAALRAYLMSTVLEPDATFNLYNAAGSVVLTAPVGALLGTWTHSDALVYDVYAIDFPTPAAGTYTLQVSGPQPAVSPLFAVSDPESLYSGLLLNSLFFYESERDGPNYIPNVLRTAPGHVSDRQAAVYQTPPLDMNDNIATTGAPLTPTGARIDGSGGWWDAGDYMKYVETISYAVTLQEIGIRDFPKQMGGKAPLHPPAPPAALSYAGTAAGAPARSDFTAEAAFGIDFLLKMWDDHSKTLYYQVGNSQDFLFFPGLLSDYDIWRLPQADDTWAGCDTSATFICHRPVFVAGPAGSKISPNLAGRLSAAFAVCSVLNRATQPNLADQCLKKAEDIFELANTALPDPAASVDSGSCRSGCLLTIVPFDGYPETVWDDDMELGATELSLALRGATSAGTLVTGLPHTDPAHYLAQAARFAQSYIARIYNPGYSETLNLYDVSGLAHFELYRAMMTAGNPAGLALTAAQVRAQLLQQVSDAVTHAQSDPWGFGASWSSDTTSHGGGISVMASEAGYLTGNASYGVLAQRWMGNVLGANAWGSSFIVGDGSATFPDCIQHQVANLAGSLDGTAGGVPVLWGAASEGPSYAATSGFVDGMLLCPANNVDTFARFNSESSVYQDNVQSYSTTEPAIDLTATSFLMWSWRLAGQPAQ